VYRARDTKLKRDVALKVLPAALASDPDQLARFQREAEVLAALNHPSIAQIHGLEETGGTTALVMELVEDPTLADRSAGCAAHERRARYCAADRRGARSRARTRHRPPRSQARQHQSERRRLRVVRRVAGDAC
jgi:hypothetical protein